MSERVEARNVSMYPQDWQVVDAAGKQVGVSTSTSLRMIVRQWAQQFQAALQRDPATAEAAPADVDDAQA